MMRASIYLPETLHQRLVMVSRRKQTNLSNLARKLLEKGLSTEEEKNLDDLYNSLGPLVGFIQTPITNASASIDEILYGEKGAWRGTIPGDE